MDGGAVPAIHRAHKSLFYAPLGHIGVRGGLNLCSPSTAPKVICLVIRDLHFRRVHGDLQERPLLCFTSTKMPILCSKSRKIGVADTKSGRECVMWSAKFGKNRYGYGHILREMHNSLYEEVESKYGMERGDSIEGRNVSHLSKRDYIRKLAEDAKQAEKAVKGLQTMTRRLEAQIFRSQSQLEEIE